MEKPAGDASIWAVISTDPEVGHRLRERIRLASGVRAIPHKDGVVLVGGAHPEMFSGFGVRSVLSRVLPLLNGTRTVAQLEAECDGIDPLQIRNLVANLFLSGLLRTGRESRDATETEYYLDRLIGYTGTFRSGTEAAGHLETRRIALFAPADETARLLSLFTRTTGGTGISIRGADQLEADTDLLVAIWAPRMDDPAPIFARASELGIAALNIEIFGRDARFGPFILPRLSASYACYAAAHEPASRHGRAAKPDQGSERFWSAVAMHGAISILAGLSKQPPVNAFTDYIWKNGRHFERKRTIARLHSWETDGSTHPLPIDADTPGYEGWKQYCSVALQSADIHPPNAYFMHFKSENIQAIYERCPAIYSGDTVPLPNGSAIEMLAAEPAVRARPLSTSALSILATYSAGFGIRDGRPQRFAPTGGNLGSTLLMMLVRDVDDLEPGAYWYDAQNGLLERVNNINCEDIIRQFDFDDAPMIILTFANMSKVARKYGAFSFNISWYDSGVLLAYLDNLAGALDLALIDMARPDQSSFNEALGIPQSSLLLTGVVGVSPNARPRDSKRPFSGVDDVVASIKRRRGVRAWSAEDVKLEVAQSLLALADETLLRFNRISRLDLRLSLILALKLSDAPDGLYRYARGEELTLLTAYPRSLHWRLLSQTRLTESPLIVFPNIDLRRAIELAGDAGVESAYKAAGAVVGELWLKSDGIGLAGTACGGTFEGEVRAVTGRHGLDHFTPLALCLGPVTRAGAASDVARVVSA